MGTLGDFGVTGNPAFVVLQPNVAATTILGLDVPITRVAEGVEFTIFDDVTLLGEGESDPIPQGTVIGGGVVEAVQAFAEGTEDIGGEGEWYFEAKDVVESTDKVRKWLTEATAAVQEAWKTKELAKKKEAFTDSLARRYLDSILGR